MKTSTTVSGVFAACVRAIRDGKLIVPLLTEQQFKLEAALEDPMFNTASDSGKTMIEPDRVVQRSLFDA